MTYTVFERFTASFQPRRTDDLREGADAWIGREIEWEAMWLITDEDGGDYVGEWACSPVDRTEPAPFAWVPSGDLRVLDGA